MSKNIKDTLSALDISREEASSTTTNQNSVIKDSSGVLDLVVQTVKYDPNSILNCPHDFPDLTSQMDTEDGQNTEEAHSASALDNSTAMALNKTDSNGTKTNLSDLFIRTSQNKFNLPECFQVFFFFMIFLVPRFFF